MSNDDKWLMRFRAVGHLYDRMGLGSMLSIAAFVFIALDVRGQLSAIAKTQTELKQAQVEHNQLVERLAVSIEVSGRLSQAELKAQTKLQLITCVTTAENNSVRKQCIEAVAEK